MALFSRDVAAPALLAAAAAVVIAVTAWRLRRARRAPAVSPAPPAGEPALAQTVTGKPDGQRAP